MVPEASQTDHQTVDLWQPRQFLVVIPEESAARAAEVLKSMSLCICVRVVVVVVVGGGCRERVVWTPGRYFLVDWLLYAVHHHERAQ